MGPRLGSASARPRCDSTTVPLTARANRSAGSANDAAGGAVPNAHRLTLLAACHGLTENPALRMDRRLGGCQGCLAQLRVNKRAGEVQQAEERKAEILERFGARQMRVARH